MIAGGFRSRGRLLRFDLTRAPWHAARERLALPLAVSMLCVIGASIASALAQAGMVGWVGWWALLFLAGAVGAVVGAASGRRYLTITASSALLILMAQDSFLLLADSNRSQWRWEAQTGMGGVSLFAIWLPVALLLISCAGAVGSAGGASRRGKALIISLPVVMSVASALAAARWPTLLILLGVVLIYAPLALVAGMVYRGAVRQHSVTRTAAALLVAASCFPVLWLLAFVVRYPSALEPWFPLLYFGCGALVACVMIRFLIRDRAGGARREECGATTSAWPGFEVSAEAQTILARLSPSAGGDSFRRDSEPSG